ncbi:hypothetical protein BBK82_25125 [Lentzea guizhouensis]|uniref:Uncharacterized protein n=1 Tax=Lentzea guizhouensis TaxID=1586287 RepID=A0A1B2HMA5_9PSEU|nr:hypothetical protein [Lentzea guizhouensis]ANZ38862.1 hypothetical protein BBK82_25125 [Lentzea guizhouensis]
MSGFRTLHGRSHGFSRGVWPPGLTDVLPVWLPWLRGVRLHLLNREPLQLRVPDVHGPDLDHPLHLDRRLPGLRLSHLRQPNPHRRPRRCALHPLNVGPPTISPRRFCLQTASPGNFVPLPLHRSYFQALFRALDFYSLACHLGLCSLEARFAGLCALVF